MGIAARQCPSISLPGDSLGEWQLRGFKLVVVVTGFHPNGIIYGPAALTKLTWTLLIN
jgi:hypothetical protein